MGAVYPGSAVPCGPVLDDIRNREPM